MAWRRTNAKPLSETILTQFLGVWVKVELSIDDIDHIAIVKMHFFKMANEKMRTFYTNRVPIFAPAKHPILFIYNLMIA